MMNLSEILSSKCHQELLNLLHFHFPLDTDHHEADVM